MSQHDSARVLNDSAHGYDDLPLHVVLASHYPIALCGHRVSDPWDAKHPAGRDRCVTCLEVARSRAVVIEERS